MQDPIVLSTSRKLTKLFRDVLTANKKATITIKIIPGKGLGYPVDIDVSNKVTLGELPEE